NSSTSRRWRRNATTGLLAALVTACLVTSAHAVDRERAMSQYIRDRWESDNGFPGGPVHAITQTSDGYLWIGAEKGLVRFDGLTFRLFQPPGPTSGADSTVLSLAADPGGGFWAQLRSANLVRYHDGFEDLHARFPLSQPLITAMSLGK